MKQLFYIDGCDKIGKTTIIHELKKKLSNYSYYKLPSKKFQLYNDITDLFRFLIDNYNTHQYILNDENDKIIIDRSFLSTLVYQVYLPNISQEERIYRLTTTFKLETLLAKIYNVSYKANYIILIAEPKLIESRVQKSKIDTQEQKLLPNIIEYLHVNEIYSQLQNFLYLQDINYVKITGNLTEDVNSVLSVISEKELKIAEKAGAGEKVT